MPIGSEIKVMCYQTSLGDQIETWQEWLLLYEYYIKVLIMHKLTNYP